MLGTTGRVVQPLRWLAGFLGFYAVTLTASESVNPLERERWEHRPLVVVTSDEQASAFRDFSRRLDENASGFEERDMIRYVITPNGATRAGEVLSEAERDALVRAVDASPENKSEFILVGKDGGIKLRGPFETTIDRIFQRIDQMPMRQREMHQGQ